MPPSPPRSPSSTPSRTDDGHFTDADSLDAPRDGRPAGVTFVSGVTGSGPGAAARAPSVDERREAMIVATERTGAGLVSLSEGRKDRPMTVTIHGINASPDAVRSLSGRAVAAGDAVKTLAYDDRGKSLETTAQGLVEDLGEWLAKHPGRTLRVDAHSMGGRVALHALDLLCRKGKLSGRKVELNLIASPIHGVAAAAALHLAPPLAGDIVRTVLGPSSSDMSPISAFQGKLDAIRFPENVQVRVFTGGKDGVVSADGAFEQLAGKLEAMRVHFPEADHDTAVEMAAAWLDRHG